MMVNTNKTINNIIYMSTNLSVPTMSELAAQGKQPEILFWVGCAGSFK